MDLDRNQEIRDVQNANFIFSGASQLNFVILSQDEFSEPPITIKLKRSDGISINIFIIVISILIPLLILLIVIGCIISKRRKRIIEINNNQNPISTGRSPIILNSNPGPVYGPVNIPQESFSPALQTIENLIGNNENINYENNIIASKNKDLFDYYYITYLISVTYDKNLNSIGEDNCAICIERILNGVLVLKLPCNHIFHETCIKKWININITSPKCPSCNDDIQGHLEKNREDLLRKDFIKD